MLAGVLDDVREQDAGDLAAYIPEWTVDGRRRRGQQLHDSVDVEAVRLRPRPRSARPERGVALRRSFVGRNPLTGEQVISERTARDVISVMTSCGMYDASGSWLLRLPAKSGVSGGLLALAPSPFGVGVFSPRLDSHGNSTRGQLLLERLSDVFGMHMFEQHEAGSCPSAAPSACWRRCRPSSWGHLISNSWST